LYQKPNTFVNRFFHFSAIFFKFFKNSQNHENSSFCLVSAQNEQIPAKFAGVGQVGVFMSVHERHMSVTRQKRIEDGAKMW